MSAATGAMLAGVAFTALMAGLGLLAAARSWLGDIREAARRERKIDDLLERLVDTANDHEARLRQGGL